MDEYDSDDDLMPDGAFSKSDDCDFANPSDVNELIEEYDSEIDDPSTFSEFEDDVDDTELQQLVEQASRVVVAMVGVAHFASLTRKSTHD